MERKWFFNGWYTYYRRVFLIGHHVKYWWRWGSIFVAKFSKGLPFFSKDFETLYKCYRSIHTYKMGTFATWEKKKYWLQNTQMYYKVCAWINGPFGQQKMSNKIHIWSILTTITLIL
jgi:hypothetical protein